MAPDPSVAPALCMTVKNKLLARNLSYHRAAGVDAILCPTTAARTVLSPRFATFRASMSRSVRSGGFPRPPATRIAIAVAGVRIDHRPPDAQCPCRLPTAQLAGHEWMISLDADELLSLQDPLGIEGSLIRFSGKRSAGGRRYPVPTRRNSSPRGFTGPPVSRQQPFPHRLETERPYRSGSLQRPGNHAR